MKRMFKRLMAFMLGIFGFSSLAMADGLTAPTYATGDVYTIAGAILTAIAVIWGIRKAISFANRG